MEDVSYIRKIASIVLLALHIGSSPSSPIDIVPLDHHEP